jgi:hypothetical protein
VFDGRAKSATDVDGFLQFAEYLALSDTIYVNAFEPPAIATRTADICETIRTLGVLPDALARSAGSREDYLLACDQAAVLCQDEINVTFMRTVGNPPVTPEMPQPQFDLQQRLIDAVQGELDDSSVAVLERVDGVHPATLASLYMITRSPDLRDAAHQMVAEGPHWSSYDTSRLDTYCRIFLNDILARQLGASMPLQLIAHAMFDASEHS